MYLSCSSDLSCIGYNISIMLFMQVDLAWKLGHHEGAKRASACSRDLGIIAIVTGILMLLLIIVWYLEYVL